MTDKEAPVAQDRIYLSSPDVTTAEESALVSAFQSDWIAPLGPEVDAFERELAHRTSRRYAVALSSGTAALHLGLLTLGVGPGDLVLTSTLTFAATTNAILYTGAVPVFVDADATGNMNPSLLEEAFQALEREGKRPKAVVPVDLFGKVADYELIMSIAAKRDVPVLSDAAESMGATRNGHPAGSFGDLAAISFNGNKIMTTSGGGVLLTNDPAHADFARYLATQARRPVAHYEHHHVGYNYRLSNLLAAIGRVQLSRLDSMIERRKIVRFRYRGPFNRTPGIQLFGEPSENHDGTTSDNYWLSSILIDPHTTKTTPTSLRLALEERNIEARPLWKPMHLQPAFCHFRSFIDGTSEKQFYRGLSLPSGSVLGVPQMNRIESAMMEALGRACGASKESA